VLEALSSPLANKYSEGYPKKRYYQGNAYADEIEQLAIDRAKTIFQAEHANVQPYSGSPANLAVYHALLRPGDKILGLRLDMGGHLTHGHLVSATSHYYQAFHYGVDQKTELLDYDQIRALAKEIKPKIIVSGATAYPRQIDFKKFQEIAEEVGAYTLADISHIAGLVAGKAHPSPFPFTDVVMTTTHKTLRGPRGAIILCKKEDRLAKISNLDEKEAAKEKDLAGKIDRSVFPGLQGGPHMNVIAAKAVAFQEALQPEFSDYAKQVVKNAQTLAQALLDNGIQLVTGGTDNHLILIKLSPGQGKPAAFALEEAGICCNANTIPYDPSTPFKPSGLRLGTPALTTRGMKEPEMHLIGLWISQVLKDLNNPQVKEQVRRDVEQLCLKFPVY
jgi:glycine hydroxymethyltransferase